jgi:branched-chain amino acid transport system permease protein
MDAIFNSFLSSLWAFGFLSLATFGITLIFKTSSTTNFAQGMIGIIGAYITSFILSNEGINDLTGKSIELSDFSALLILPMLGGIAASFLFGMFIDMVIFRHAKFTNAATKQIITMGIVIVVTGIIPFIFGATTNRESYRFSGQTISLGNFKIPVHSLTTLIFSVVIIGVIFILLKYTKWGLGVRAVASNEKVAGIMGINTNAINALSWGIAGAIGALCAITYTAGIRMLNSSVMIEMQINAFYSSILGGFGTFYGPLLGSLIFTLGQSFIPSVLIKVNLGQWSNTVLYLLILFGVLIRPMGLFGKKVLKKV